MGTFGEKNTTRLSRILQGLVKNTLWCGAAAVVDSKVKFSVRSWCGIT